MQIKSLEVLEQTQVPASQAHALVRAIWIEIEAAKDTLATKEDVPRLRGGIETKTAELRGDLGTQIHATADRTTRQRYGATLTLMSMLAVR